MHKTRELFTAIKQYQDPIGYYKASFTAPDCRGHSNKDHPVVKPALEWELRFKKLKSN